MRNLSIVVTVLVALIWGMNGITHADDHIRIPRDPVVPENTQPDRIIVWKNIDKVADKDIVDELLAKGITPSPDDIIRVYLEHRGFGDQPGWISHLKTFFSILWDRLMRGCLICVGPICFFCD